MSGSRGINQLKLEIAKAADINTEGELLLQLLDKLASVNNREITNYACRLLEISEKNNSIHYKAWGNYFLARFELLNDAYDKSVKLTLEAIEFFKIVNSLNGLAKCYNNLGTIEENRGNYKEALEYHLKAFQIWETLSDTRGLANSYLNLATCYSSVGNYGNALNNYSNSLKISEKAGDKKGIAVALNNLGITHERMGNYSDALHYYLRAFHIFEESENKHELANSLHNIGNIYVHQHNYTEALKNYYQTLHLREKIGARRGIANALSNIGVVQELQGNYSLALETHTSALVIRKEIGDKPGIAGAYNNIGIVLEMLGNYAESLENHSHSLDIRKNIGDQVGMAYCYNGIASVYGKLGNYNEAVKNGLNALKIGNETGNKDVIKETSLQLASYFKNAGNFEMALKYFEKYHELESEMLGEQTRKQLTSLNFMHNLEQKEKDLEIEHLRNVDLKREKDISEQLLLNILPAEVAVELKEKGSADAKHFANVTVLFTDFKDFTKVSEKLPPQQLVDELHNCFSAFDDIIAKYNIEKIKTVGDAYLAVAGLPVPNSNHAEDIIKAALEIKTFMEERISRSQNISGKTEILHAPNTFEVRIGVHSGPVVAGIVGKRKFAYDIWGDTVNTAARMEQNSEAGRINISQATYQLIKDKFVCSYRGEISAKNKGNLAMYFVEHPVETQVSKQQGVATN
jgi:class 3 adenylate cyclase/Tfp pilus assembly protein PilF